MTEQEAINILSVCRGCMHLVNGECFGDTKCFEAKELAIKALGEIQQYRALGTVEELQKAKTQYEGIALCAERISLSGLCDYKMAHHNIVSSLKVMSNNALEEYIKIGTIEELREARERQMPKKPNVWGDGYDDKGEIIYDMYDCPNCGASYEIGYEEYNHCPKCGQLMDLSWLKEGEEE